MEISNPYQPLTSIGKFKCKRQQQGELYYFVCVY